MQRPTGQRHDGARELTIDGQHTTVEFAVRHMMVATVRGVFSEVGGTVVLDAADPGNSSVEVEIGAASIDTRVEERDAHLRSADFLDAERYPAIRFRSIRVAGDPVLVGKPFRIVGELTIRGTTREVELEAENTGRVRDHWSGADRIGFSAHGKIDRREWGLTWNQALETGGLLVSNEVELRLEVSAVVTQAAAAA